MKTVKKIFTLLSAGVLMSCAAGETVAQDSIRSLYIPVPAEVCSCSDEARQEFERKVSEAIAYLESQYENAATSPDEEKAIEQALKEAGFTPAEAAALEGMSEAEKEAYALQIAQKAMATAMTATTPEEQEKLRKQMNDNSKVLSDLNTLQNLLMPVNMEFSKLEQEADAWYNQNLKPLYEISQSQYGDEHEATVNRIVAAEKEYCTLFSPRNLDLIRKEVKMLEQAYPVIRDISTQLMPEWAGASSTQNKESDPVWLYLKAVSKSFEYHIDGTHWNIGD